LYLFSLSRRGLLCTFKGGVNQLSRVLALVNVNSVAATFIYRSGAAERLDDRAYLEKVVERLPIRRVGTDVAAAVVYLASRTGALVTGSVLILHGGWTAQ
jgi:NAD(P)-dependent dehydrogenase (short-subunit alcohol dehydrogenase family)